MRQSKSWRDKATAANITKKVERRRNPATTFTQLANELGAPVYSNNSGGGPAVSRSFREHVRTTMGKTNIFA